jgi:hypothetical protein
MLNYLLGWTVGLGSLGFYLAGFLLPEVRRKKDAIWSGVGLIYALALLTNGDRISVGLVLGQLASTTLIGWFGWQILQQRRDLSDSVSQTPIPDSVQAVFPFLKQGWERLIATYTSQSDDDGDLLASSFKKASAALAERSDSPKPPKPTPAPSDPKVAPVHSQEQDEWENDPSGNPSAQNMPVNSSPAPSTVAESAEHTEVVPEEVVPQIETEVASAMVVDAIAPPEAPPIVSVNIAEPVEHAEIAPAAEEEMKAVDTSMPPEAQAPPEAAIASSAQEPDSQLESSQSSSNAPAGEEENWPPKDSMI